jgi:sulfate adenylyltransferase
MVGTIKVEDIFEIDPIKRVEKIYGTSSLSHPGLQTTLNRLGKIAISGEFNIEFNDVKEIKELIISTKKRLNAKDVTGIVMAARPLNRAHERVIRLSLDKSDMVVIFLLKPYTKDIVPYQLRYESLKILVDNYLPSSRVLIVPFDNTYLFAGINEVILDAIALQNFGCNKFVIGKHHAGLGVYYEKHEMKSIFDTLKGINISIEVTNDFVYCDICSTLVSVDTCPHGQHHHIAYHSDSILELLKSGILPPSILMRKEITSLYLTHFFPNRFKHLERLYYDFVPNFGLMEEHNERDFYLALSKLYQTSSLT